VRGGFKRGFHQSRPTRACPLPKPIRTPTPAKDALTARALWSSIFRDTLKDNAGKEFIAAGTRAGQKTDIELEKMIYLVRALKVLATSTKESNDCQRDRAFIRERAGTRRHGALRPRSALGTFWTAWWCRAPQWSVWSCYSSASWASLAPARSRSTIQCNRGRAAPGFSMQIASARLLRYA